MGGAQGRSSYRHSSCCAGDHDRLGLNVSQPLCSRVETAAEESGGNPDTKTPDTPPTTPPHPSQSWTEQAAVGASPLPTKYPIAACLTESCGKRCPSKGSLKAPAKTQRAVWLQQNVSLTTGLLCEQNVFLTRSTAGHRKHHFSLKLQVTDLAASNFCI